MHSHLLWASHRARLWYWRHPKHFFDRVMERGKKERKEPEKNERPICSPNIKTTKKPEKRISIHIQIKRCVYLAMTACGHRYLWCLKVVQRVGHVVGIGCGGCGQMWVLSRSKHVLLSGEMRRKIGWLEIRSGCPMSPMGKSRSRYGMTHAILEVLKFFVSQRLERLFGFITFIIIRIVVVMIIIASVISIRLAETRPGTHYIGMLVLCSAA